MKKGVSGVVWIAAVYLLLCAPVRLCAHAAADGASVFAGANVTLGALCLRFDGEGTLLPGKVLLAPRYGKRKRQRAKGGAARGWRAVKAVLSALDGRWRGAVRLRARMGGGDAAATALAVGAVKAGVFALLGLLPEGVARDVRVDAEHGGMQFLASARCIGVASAGDIMLAAARAATKKRKARAIMAKRAGRLRKHREGTGWISIPSRA